MENFWAYCLLKFEKELSAQQYNTWIKPLKARVNGEAVQIVAPNKFVMQWVKSKFFSRIATIASELSPNAVVELIVDTSEQAAPVPSAAPTKTTQSPVEAIVATATQQHSTRVIDKKPVSNRAPAKHLKSEKGSGLNDSFLFDNYVTGRANQLARAAAIQVAGNPGQAYNPLFIYGGVGLGKTHLLQAIGNELKKAKPEANIRYLHAERYVSDVVKAYENKAFDEFKQQYHSLDLLLIDDSVLCQKNPYTRRVFLRL